MPIPGNHRGLVPRQSPSLLRSKHMEFATRTVRSGEGDWRIAIHRAEPDDEQDGLDPGWPRIRAHLAKHRAAALSGRRVRRGTIDQHTAFIAPSSGTRRCAGVDSGGKSSTDGSIARANEDRLTVSCATPSVSARILRRGHVVNLFGCRTARADNGMRQAAIFSPRR